MDGGSIESFDDECGEFLVSDVGAHIRFVSGLWVGEVVDAGRVVGQRRCGVMVRRVDSLQWEWLALVGVRQLSQVNSPPAVMIRSPRGRAVDHGKANFSKFEHAELWPSCQHSRESLLPRHGGSYLPYPIDQIMASRRGGGGGSGRQWLHGKAYKAKTTCRFMAIIPQYIKSLLQRHEGSLSLPIA